MDEVGRGCLFGPVFAGAVVLEAANASRLQREGLTDSKRLSARRRGELVPLIEQEAEAWGLGQASAREIDRLGIRPATELAMLRALQRLPNRPELVLVDGNLPLRPWTGEQRSIVAGDQQALAIAAASVIAKQYRELSFWIGAHLDNRAAPEQQTLLELSDTNERLERQFEMLDHTRRQLAARTVLMDLKEQDV